VLFVDVMLYNVLCVGQEQEQCVGCGCYVVKFVVYKTGTGKVVVNFGCGYYILICVPSAIFLYSKHKL